MAKANNIASDDLFALNRFISAQQEVYDRVLKELNDGSKQTHWMWYIFPQLERLGQSKTSKYYAIKSKEEAIAYLNHPLLGSRLKECAEAVFAVEGRTAKEIFGYPDDRKLKSSMTLFAHIASDSVFDRVLDKYFHERDEKTLQLLAEK